MELKREGGVEIECELLAVASDGPEGWRGRSGDGVEYLAPTAFGQDEAHRAL
jgi:hypothetical protein